jgi:hypothetical protein
MATATRPATASPPAFAPERPDAAVWPAWQRFMFRFFFIYLLLQMAPWTWFDAVPGVRSVTRYAGTLDSVAVTAANARAFHVREHLVSNGYGSGDTSYAWAQLWLYLSLAAGAALVWTLVDRRHRAYPRLLYWLRTLVRYWLAAAALSYGIIKLFMLQMPFPTLSQLATPLGDFLPMRLSWMFVGYSWLYQVFSGAVETLAGLLLLRRNTVTLGLMVAAGAFANVVLINLSYDVPVKLFASHLLLACVFLLALDARRLYTFLVLNRAAPGTTAYEPPDARPWHRYARWALKGAMLVLIAAMPVADSWTRYRALAGEGAAPPFRAGVYDVRRYVRNGDTVPALVTDSLRWRDVIVDNGGQGSVGTRDTLFWQRYRRGHFRYAADTARQTVAVWKTSTARDSVFLFTMRYDVPDSDTVRLWAKVRGDSVYAELVRTNRHFQLAERQFHWLSEYNR